jgi:hypothetical protein
MADTKISAMTAISAVAAADEFPVADASDLTVAYAATAAQIKTFVNDAPVFAAGSATAGSKPVFTSGTLLTTAEAGAHEYDGAVHYLTHAASERGVVQNPQLITLTTAFTTAGGTTALQKLFNSPTNGAITVAANTTYMFECFYSLSAMSATSGTHSFGFGGTATFTRVFYLAISDKGATGIAAALHTLGTGTAAVAMSAANTTTTGKCHVRGKLVIGATGTIIPSFATSIAAASIVANDSFFCIWPVGSNTVQSVGNWS